jgi:lysophospholipase-2
LIKLLFIINIFNKQIKPKTSSILLLQMSVLPVVLKARTLHTATMIFLHGLGDTGHGWAGILNTIRPDYMKIVCPTAPSIPVSLNNGMVMPAWYDIKDISSDNSAIREDIQGVEASTKVLQTLIDMEALALKDAGRSRIMIGGFSQGGAIALNTLLRSNDKGKLAGCAALSTYIPGT